MKLMMDQIVQTNLKKKETTKKIMENKTKANFIQKITEKRKNKW